MKPGRVKGLLEMSSMAQLVAIAAFLVYSTGYLLFIGWASHRSSPQPAPKPRLRPIVLTGLLLPLTVLGILLFRL